MARMRKEEGGSKGSPAWMSTFSDLMNLLPQEVNLLEENKKNFQWKIFCFHHSPMMQFSFLPN